MSKIGLCDIPPIRAFLWAIRIRTARKTLATTLRSCLQAYEKALHDFGPLINLRYTFAGNADGWDTSSFVENLSKSVVPEDFLLSKKARNAVEAEVRSLPETTPGFQRAIIDILTKHVFTFD